MSHTLPYPYPDLNTNQWDAFALLRNLQFLAESQHSFGSPGSTPTYLNLKGDATAAGSTLTLTADIVTVRAHSLNQVRIEESFSHALNLATAASAGGRDVSGNFNSAFVHIYAISDGTNFDLIASATAPPTGPTMPNGYTFWGYLTTLRVGSTNNKWDDSSNIRDNIVFWGVKRALITAGSATSYTSVTKTSHVPTIALNYEISTLCSCTSNGSGAIESNCHISLDGTNSLFIVWRAFVAGLANSTAFTVPGRSSVLPNDLLYYKWDTTTGSGAIINLDSSYYTLPR